MSKAVLVVAALAGCGSSGTAAPPTTTVGEATTSSTSTTSSTTTSTTTPTTTLTTTSTTTSTTTTATTTTSTTTTSTTTTAPPGPTAAECVAQLPPATRIGQVLLPVVDQAGLADVVALAEHGLIGGVVLIGEPDEGIADAID